MFIKIDEVEIDAERNEAEEIQNKVKLALNDRTIGKRSNIYTSKKRTFLNNLHNNL